MAYDNNNNNNSINIQYVLTGQQNIYLFCENNAKNIYHLINLDRSDFIRTTLLLLLDLFSFRFAVIFILNFAVLHNLSTVFLDDLLLLFCLVQLSHFFMVTTLICECAYRVALCLSENTLTTPPDTTVITPQNPKIYSIVSMHVSIWLIKPSLNSALRFIKFYCRQQCSIINKILRQAKEHSVKQSNTKMLLCLCTESRFQAINNRKTVSKYDPRSEPSRAG